MSERVKITGLFGSGEHAVGDVVIDELVQAGKLPRDFEFRLFAILDKETRIKVGTQDVLAALGYGEPSGNSYITDELPNCMYLDTFAELRPILQAVDEDYHRLYDLECVAHDNGKPDFHAVHAWEIYVDHLDADLSERIHGLSRDVSTHKQRGKLMYRLGQVVIKDSALLEIYNDPQQLPGHGKVKQRLLYDLLLDNHPQLEAK